MRVERWILVSLLSLPAGLPAQEIEVVVPRPAGGFDAASLQALYERHYSRRQDARSIRLFCLDDQGGLEPAESFLPAVQPPPQKRGASHGGHARGSDAASGFLSGKTVYLSPGHGWFHDPPQDRWETQRPVTNALVEDLHSNDAVSHFLTRHLENMGADVWVIRERDRAPLRIVDNGEVNPANGTYQEHGAPSQFLDSTFAGYGPAPLPYDGFTNPLDQGGMRLMAVTTGSADASVVWTPDLPEDGDYAVYVSYGAWTNRPDDAHYEVRHRGGSTHVRVHQRFDGFTWRYLGRFPFQAGHHPGQQEVVLWNDTQDGGAAYLSVDAVRFGAGTGVIDRGDGVSGRPRFEEAARYATQYRGAPSTVYMARGDDRNSDVVARPRYAAWENETGEDAVYVSWHTNAPSPATGTSSYIYSINPVAGSADLQTSIHDEIIADVRAGYDPSWVDRGKLSAAFGEVNPAHNPETPAVLLEVAFHDTPADALRLKDSRLVNLVARSVAQGVAKYFAGRDGVPVDQAPEPPRRLRVSLAADDVARVAWAPPPAGAPGLFGDPPTAYVVEWSGAPRAFPSQERTTTASFVDVSVPRGVPTYFRVRSENPGGRSFPTETLAVLPPAALPAPRSTVSSPSRVLFVQGYTRVGPYLLPEFLQPVAGQTPVTAGASGSLPVERLLFEEVNTSDYVVEHVAALRAFPAVSLEAASRGAVEAGDLSLADHDLVLWAAGRQAEVHGGDLVDDTALNATERTLLAAFLGQGGRLLISGAEIAYDLDRDGDPNDPESQFMHGWLRAAYAADTAATFRFQGSNPGPMSMLGARRFDNGQGPAYAVDWPDVLQTIGGSVPALEYLGGAGGTAATYFEGGERVLYLGFPFETIRGNRKREEALVEAVRLLLR